MSGLPEFRAFKESENRMIYWEELLTLEVRGRLVLGDVLSGVYLKAVMQSLGLKDDDGGGTKIYEADVIAVGDYRFLVEPIGTLEGDENHRGYCVSSITTGFVFLIDRSILKGKVIGNIYENPELAEQP